LGFFDKGAYVLKHKNKLNYKILFSYADGLKKFLFISAIATILRVFINFITPQVIRVTVDFVIGDKQINFIAPIMYIINLIGGRQGLRENIWISAVVVLTLALITCICDYIGRVTIAKGSEGIIKNIRNGENVYETSLQNNKSDIL